MAFLCIPIDPAACTPSSVYPQSVPITQVTSPEGLGPRRGKLTTITVFYFFVNVGEREKPSVYSVISQSLLNYHQDMLRSTIGKPWLRSTSTHSWPVTCRGASVWLPHSSQSCPLVRCVRFAPKQLARFVSSVPSPPTPWIDRFPPGIRPYLHLTRIDKPIGTLLLFYPCTWSITMASYALDTLLTTNLAYIALFGLGALVMRGAGCTINDMWDKNLDRAVERTRMRPLAQGALTRNEALVFLGGQLAIGLCVLMQLNWNSILLGASSLSVVTLYPLMKRITYWPQAVLGLAFNWGALLGWSAVAGTVNWSVCVPLYLGGVCWTLVYDTIYAHQDKIDDVKAGIRSTALLFGEKSRTILSALSATAMSLVTYAGVLNAQGAPFYLGIGLGGAQLAKVLWRTNFDDRVSCWKGFVGCGWAGFWVWMGALADYATKVAGML